MSLLSPFYLLNKYYAHFYLIQFVVFKIICINKFWTNVIEYTVDTKKKIQNY